MIDFLRFLNTVMEHCTSPTLIVQKTFMICYSLSSVSFPSTVCQFLFSKYLNAIDYSHTMLISDVFITNFFQSEYLSVVNYLSGMVNEGIKAISNFFTSFMKTYLRVILMHLIKA